MTIHYDGDGNGVETIGKSERAVLIDTRGCCIISLLARHRRRKK
jgi:hypothetical protein